MAQRRDAGDAARRPGGPAVASAVDLRIHCALNLGRPMSAVRVEARLGSACQISASVSADAGVACFNAWGRLPVPEDMSCLQIKVLRRAAAGREGAGRGRARGRSPGRRVACAQRRRAQASAVRRPAAAPPARPRPPRSSCHPSTRTSQPPLPRRSRCASACPRCSASCACAACTAASTCPSSTPRPAGWSAAWRCRRAARCLSCACSQGSCGGASAAMGLRTTATRRTSCRCGAQCRARPRCGARAEGPGRARPGAAAAAGGLDRLGSR
jgi:hypothetical protein